MGVEIGAEGIGEKQPVIDFLRHIAMSAIVSDTDAGDLSDVADTIAQLRLDVPVAKIVDAVDIKPKGEAAAPATAKTSAKKNVRTKSTKKAKAKRA